MNWIGRIFGMWLWIMRGENRRWESQIPNANAHPEVTSIKVANEVDLAEQVRKRQEETGRAGSAD